MNVAIKERPILFNAAMVRAILDGSKTQTRRAVNPQPPENFTFGDVAAITNGTHWAFSNSGLTGGKRGAWPEDPKPGIICPYGQKDDQLWVRETFAIVPRTAYSQSTGVHQTIKPDCDHDAAIFKAGWDRSAGGIRWRPSIHMHRWASRIQLEIVSVRVERLDDISEKDAMAEGITAVDFRPDDGFPICTGYMVGKDDGNTPLAQTATQTFRALWEAINGAESWSANPWVWVVEFKRINP